MKKCPNCKRIYDISQSFCLDDGTSLEIETEVDTVVLPNSKKSKWKIPLLFITFLLLFGGIISFWMWSNLSALKSEVAQNNNTNKTETNIQTKPRLEEKTESDLQSNTINNSESNENTSENLDADSEITNQKKQESDDDSTETEVEKVPNKPKGKPIKKQSKLFTFELLQCNISDSLITCDFNITNEGKDRNFELLPMSSLAVDNRGKQYKGYNVITSELSNVDKGNVLLVSGVPVTAKLMIEEVDTDAKSLALLELKFCTQCGWSSEEVQFRNIKLWNSK